MKFRILISLIIDWAKEKGILEKATPITQFSKTVEEVEELNAALLAQSEGLETFINAKGKRVDTKEEIADSVGDITVTLIIQCEMQGLDFKECLIGAYNIISKRNGKMIDGIFVKSEDL
jgi:NTP pyrophosphatase (non-canonical NTP hydrolase)